MRTLLLAVLTIPACARSTGATRGIDPLADAATPAVDLYARRVALVVGISDYEDSALDLSFARSDAEAVADVLHRRFGFEVTGLYDADARRASVLAALDDLRSLGPDDAVVVFWGGHGTTERLPAGDQLGYLVPYDGSFQTDELLTSALSMEELRTVLGRRVPAKHKFLVVDACYSGLLATRALDLPPHTAAYLAEIAREDAYQVLTAGRADQTVLDSGPGGHSVFTYRLLQRLERVADYVTAEELSVDIRRKVQSDAHRRNHSQTPDYGKLHGTGDFVFVPTAGAPGTDLPALIEPDPAPLELHAGTLTALVSNLQLRLMLLEGQKNTTVERLDEFLEGRTDADWDRVLIYARPQLDDVLDIQSDWESTLEQLLAEDFAVTRRIAWDIQRITGVLQEIVSLAPTDAPSQTTRVRAWTEDLRTLQSALADHQLALTALQPE